MPVKDNPKSAKRQRTENPQSGLLDRGKNYINNLKENTQSAPIKQRPGKNGEKGESDYAFRRRQQEQDDNSPDNIENRSLGDMAGQRIKTEANKLKEKGTNFAKNKLGKAREYGAKKGKEGLDYAKGKGQEFLNKNPEAAKMFNKAQQVKDDFRNKIGGLNKENLQSAPIKQRPGESSGEFRQRQKREDDESPNNIKDRSLGDVAGQRLRTGINKQIGKFTNKQDNPRTAAALAKADKIKKQVALKAQKFTNRARELSRKAKILNARLKELKKQLDFKQRLKDELKKYAIRLLWPVISSALLILGKLFIVMMFMVVIIAALKYTCESNPLFDAVCSYFTGTSF